MAKGKAAMMVRAMDLATAFVGALLNEAKARGISEEQIYAAIKPQGPAIAKMVDVIAEVKPSED